MRAGDFDVLLYGARPSYSVFDNTLNVLVLERLISLVTGLEIENLTVAASPSATASEDLSGGYTASSPERRAFMLV